MQLETYRKLRSGLGAVLCSALVLLSPGLDCYAAASSVGRVRTAGPGVNAPGAMVRPVVVSGAAFLPPLSAGSPTAQFRSVSAAPAAPAAQVSAARLMPVAALPQPSALPVPSVSLRAVAAPALGPVQTAGYVLEAGSRRLQQVRDAGARRDILDAVYSGVRSAAFSADTLSVYFAPAADMPGRGVGLGVYRPEPGAAEPVPSPAALPADLAGIKIFVTRLGQEPVAATLAELGGVLAAHPELRAAMNSQGRIRIVISKSDPSGGLTKSDVPRVRAALNAFGVTAKVEVENIPIDWAKAATAAPTAASAAAAAVVPSQRGRLWRYLIGPITLPFREAIYLVRTLAASYANPTWREIAGGLVMKLAIPLVVLGQVGWIAMYDGHPVAKALALGLSFGLSVFHGIFVTTWSNLQNNIGQQRGVKYQSVFNLLYGQFWGVLFRLIAWSAIPRTTPPWSPKYWKDMGISTVFGTFFGTLAYQGLNTLYNNGRLTQGQRAAVFLFRDLLMSLAGYFFGSGSMLIFWSMFIVQQAMDLGIYLFSQSRLMKRRSIVYVADDMVAATPEFRSMYPVGPSTGEPESPLRQAWKGIVGSPFVKPIVWLVKKLFGRMDKPQS